MDGSPREESRLKLGLARGLALAVSLIVSIGILELGLRLSDAYGGQAYSLDPTGSQYKFYRFDGVLGWANAPGMRGTYERDEFRFPIRINAHGMRDAEVDRQPGARKRIAVLGDSFTWGIGVADEDRFTERLERARGVEVLNFGVAGYSPVQYRLMIGDALSFRPDLVVIAFCLGNDFADNVYFQRYGYFKPYAELDSSGETVIQGYPLPNVDDFGFREKAEGLVFARILERAISNAFFLPEQRGLMGFRSEFVYADEAIDHAQRLLADRAIQINEALLREIRDAVRRTGAELVLLPVPTKCEYAARCRGDGEVRLRDGAYRVLEASADRLGIRFVRTLDALDRTNFWQKDGHWRPSGHARIAERLDAFLENTRLLD